MDMHLIVAEKMMHTDVVKSAHVSFYLVLENIVEKYNENEIKIINEIIDNDTSGILKN